MSKFKVGDRVRRTVRGQGSEYDKPDDSSLTRLRADYAQYPDVMWLLALIERLLAEIEPEVTVEVVE